MNRVCALIVLYLGRELSETDAESIVSKMQNIGLIERPADATLVYKDADSIAKAIIAQEEYDEKNSNDATILHFVVPEGKKLQTVKFIKDEFRLTLAKAKEVVETGCIVVEHPDYDKLLKMFCKIGVRVVNLDNNMALKQAVIYINERYPNAHMDKNFLSTFIKDVLDAKDRHDDFSLALIESVRLISNASQEECGNYGLYPTLYGNICVAHNVLTSM